MPEANMLLERALNETTNLRAGEVFLVKGTCFVDMSGTGFREVIGCYLEHYF